jgi:hypothetical protein
VRHDRTVVGSLLDCGVEQFYIVGTTRNYASPLITGTLASPAFSITVAQIYSAFC